MTAVLDEAVTPGVIQSLIEAQSDFFQDLLNIGSVRDKRRGNGYRVAKRTQDDAVGLAAPFSE